MRLNNNYKFSEAETSATAFVEENGKMFTPNKASLRLKKFREMV